MPHTYIETLLSLLGIVLGTAVLVLLEILGFNLLLKGKPVKALACFLSVILLVALVVWGSQYIFI